MVVIVVQCILGAKIQEKFGITPEDMERAATMKRKELDKKEEFLNINRKIGDIMESILDGWGSASYMRKYSE